MMSPGLRFVTVKPGKGNSSDIGVTLKISIWESAAGYVTPLTTAVKKRIFVVGSVAQFTIFVFKLVKVNIVPVRRSVTVDYELVKLNQLARLNKYIEDIIGSLISFHVHRL